MRHEGTIQKILQNLEEDKMQHRLELAKRAFFTQKVPESKGDTRTQKTTLKYHHWANQKRK